MSTLEDVRAALPEAARDLKLNLQAVLAGTGGALTPAQRWGVAAASAIAAGSPRLREAVLAEARREVEPAVLEDAVAAAALMGMNNVFYRFRHMIGKKVYSERPARLRMNRLAQPATSRADLELFSLAVSAIYGCEACLRSHEEAVLKHGLSEEHVLEAVRIAATIHGSAQFTESIVETRS